VTLVLVPFCGGGGSSLGVHRATGADVIGIDTDADACATHEAAGYTTVQADVAHYEHDPRARVTGLWLSPPCTAFSRAGRRKGIDHLPAVLAYVSAWKVGDPRWAGDPLVWLVTEPLRRGTLRASGGRSAISCLRSSPRRAPRRA
jgi:DNA (cytosine-5)-methyltransferase 1